jgi:hypothetical protein
MWRPDRADLWRRSPRSQRLISCLRRRGKLDRSWEVLLVIVAEQVADNGVVDAGLLNAPGIRRS